MNAAYVVDLVILIVIFVVFVMVMDPVAVIHHLNLKVQHYKHSISLKM